MVKILWGSLGIPLFVLVFAGVGSLAQAQNPPTAQAVVLPAEKLALFNRLEVLDRQVVPLDSASEAGKLVASAAPAFPLRPLAALMLPGGALEKWEQLLDDYLKLIDEAGDALVPMPGAGSLQLRRVIDARIAAWPPSALALYRRRLGPQAEKLLDEGKNRRRAAPLRRLVDEAFCSGPAEEALDLLGDLAFEEGEFEDALAWWGLLALPGEVNETGLLLYPQPRGDPARVRAKKILAYAFMGRISQAQRELELFRHLHPTAKGSLAGGNGLYVEILGGWIDKMRGKGPLLNQDAWNTFAGNPARNASLAVCPPVRLWVNGPTWKALLPALENAHADGPLANPAKRLAFHPIIVDDQVLVADAHSVRSYELQTGRQVIWFTLKKDPSITPDTVGERYTLTAWNHRVYARLGAAARSTLVCLELGPPGAGKLRWQIMATTPDNKPAYFEGAPLACVGGVFTALSWTEGMRTHTAVVCVDPDTGAQRWRQDVCITYELEEHHRARLSPHLLAFGGNRLFYCSHSGAVIAIDPWSGKCSWATRYASRGPRTAEGYLSPRELAPCVYADGKLFLAPADAERLYCLDAGTGHLLWTSPPVEVVHFLGVARGRVYFTTPRGVQCISAATGARRTAQAGGTWIQPSEGRLPGLGRGLLAGSWLLWPTQDPTLPYRGVTLEEGEQERFAIDKKPPPEPEFLEPTMLRAILPGNMAFGQDCLAVAGLEELAVYVPQKGLLKEQPSLRETGLAPMERSQRQTPSYARLKHQAEPAPLPRARGTLRAPLEKTWEVPLDVLDSSSPPAALMAGRVLCRRGNELLCLTAASGKSFWTQHLAHEAERVLWLGACGEVAVRAGSERIIGLDGANGDLLWDQSAPLRPWLSGVTGEDRAPVANPFAPAHFEYNQRFLYFMSDERHLAALDPVKGSYAWTLWASGGKIRPLEGGGRFRPVYAAGERYLLLQTTDGHALTLDAQTGKLVRRSPAPTPWLHPPLFLDSRHTLVAGDFGRIELLDLTTGIIAWSYTPVGPTSLTGSPTQAIGNKDQLCALVPRNLGMDLVRLDPGTGRPLWSIPFLADTIAGAVALDGKALYFLTGKKLQARALDNGKLLWEKDLPAPFAAWRLVRAGDILLAHPQEELQMPWLPFNQSPLTWPILSRFSVKRPREKHLVVIDPRDGRELQKLPLTERHGPMWLQVQADGVLVCGGGKGMMFRESSGEFK